MEDDTSSKWQAKGSGYSQIISDKTDFKIKKITRDKDGHYITIKGTFHPEDITLMNIYTLNTEAPKYIKKLLTT